MAKRGSALDAYKDDSSSFNPQSSSLPSLHSYRPPFFATMSNNPTAVRHYKLLLDSTKFQLTNIPPNSATASVMAVWGRKFVQTWVSRTSFIVLY